MIDRAALVCLSPQQRARVIYADAQSELSRRLWRAALGNADAPSPYTLSSFSARRGDVDALLQLMAGGNVDDTPAAECSCAAMPAAESAAPSPVPAVTTTPTFLGTPAAPTMADISRVPTVPAGESGLGANSRFHDMLCGAAQRTGVPASAIAALIDAEAAKLPDGSWNSFSRNARSSAAGLGQFLGGTWETLARTSGTALNRVATARGWLDDHGRVRTDCRGSLLALRYDPAAAIDAVADYARRNLQLLRDKGVPVGSDIYRITRAAYLGHHLGAGDAMKFLTDGIEPGRARTLLQAQVGNGHAEQRIAEAGNATRAHRQWLLDYVDRRVRPDRYAI